MRVRLAVSLFVLVGLAAGTDAGYSGALYYMLVYTFMNIGAFGVISYMEFDGKLGSEQRLDALAGIGYKKPVLALCMVFFMFSLAGFPPFGGFFGKVAVFAPAIDSGLVWLAIIGVLTSAISAYYYLRVLVVFFMKESDGSHDFDLIPVPLSATVVIVLCAGVIILLGVTPSVMEVTASFFNAGATAALP